MIELIFARIALYRVFVLRHIVTLLLSKNATQLKFSGFLVILYFLLLVEADFLCQLLLFYICVICVTFFNTIFYYFFSL